MTVYTTLPSGSSASTINTAIANCPSNQVVALAAGTYTLTGPLNAKAGVVLRGAGIDSTKLEPNHGEYGGAIYVGYSYLYRAIYNADYNGGGTTDWTAGHVQGSSNLTFSSPSGLAAGNIVVLDQLNDYTHVTPVGYEGNNGAGRGSGLRALEQYCRVAAVNGNTVTIWPPVALPLWTNTLSPQAFWMGEGSWIGKFGIEDLTVDGANLTGYDPYEANIYYETAQDCWIKNVKSLKPSISHVCFYGAINCEVRHSMFFDTKNAATMSYGIVPVFSSWMLIEDNVFEKVVTPVIVGASASCSVIGYNYATNMYYSQANNFLMAAFQPHNAHGYMWLMEGNWAGSSINNDFIHGSGSHNVVFRNRIPGWSPYTWPGGPSENNLFCIMVELTNHWFSTIGNVLGTAGIHDHYQSVPGAHTDDKMIYNIGIENEVYGKGWGDDPLAYSTLFRHMDYDTVTAGITYNPTNADVALPDSLYYSSKPSFFGVLSWPPFNPSNTAAAAIAYTNIPAGYRYAYGNDPTNGGNGGAPRQMRVIGATRVGTIRGM